MDFPEKIPFGLYPTPLYRLNNLSRMLNVDLWVKRDDLCGVALGGNKVRKLEYLLAEAKRSGCELVMTTGGAQSNHAMLTAACSLQLGLEPILVLKKRGITTCRGNQVLNRLMGAEVIFVDTDDYQDIFHEMDRIELERGKKAYKIPCGGSTPLGAVGYVDCIRELYESGLSFDHVVCPCGSGGTAAGILAGASVYMKESRITCVTVDTDPFDEIVPVLASETLKLIHSEAVLKDLYLEDMTGPGYAIPSMEGIEAVSLMLRQEGIVLDTCYTGKGFAGLLKMIKDGTVKTGEKVVFIHTGGAGGLFAPDWENI